VTDGCSDGRGFQIKFFDVTNNLLWPNATEVYIIPTGETRNTTLSCRTGANVCYGARTDPRGDGWWGVDLDRSKGCDNCCRTCSTSTASIRLTC
jgi:Pyruvate/2-oxoacid:ferredoxin oxidoreductase delta subunit